MSKIILPELGGLPEADQDFEMKLLAFLVASGETSEVILAALGQAIDLHSEKEDREHKAPGPQEETPKD